MEKSYLLLVEIASGQRGIRGSGPPGKSQVIWFSIGYKQLDPPGKSATPPPPPPPPPPENVGSPLEP